MLTCVLAKLANDAESASVPPFIHFCFQSDNEVESTLLLTLLLGFRKEFPFLKSEFWGEIDIYRYIYIHTCITEHTLFQVPGT